MEFYYFNDKTDIHGNHEVHKGSCSFLPAPLNRTYLGYFEYDYQAMETARTKYPYKKFDGCAHCMPTYHTS
ncbi:hypothetical protein [Streptococcus intermedius]|jgi:hypothetical protein|uniref:hypothetical protein n=1 Tax=Streptococcus intermedius TaxID=1338 RepID=UPI002000DE54|nr:hypothetical protein [Streptococcus intermedius]